ncbi:hypothetical protein HMPREF0742_00957 [Rothia aeria F0184]|uniref:Uncharacterized protein n=1 Tax=Rothia aeria F0184 TaxID=888019 RepID=U7V4W8_9MICC|nr:hypothetical protein HMPREF0742_00957 [Rothia aeria F0184]
MRSLEGGGANRVLMSRGMLGGAGASIQHTRIERKSHALR